MDHPAGRSGPSGPAGECNVRVVVRVRPLVARERLVGAMEAVHMVPGSPQIMAGSDHSYSFDEVLGSEMSQRDVFGGTVTPVLDAFLSGFNCTILAYGQTGSGKTFTMGTGLDGALDETSAGIIPRAVAHLSERLAGSAPDSCELFVSFLEIYNEEIIDLLNPAQQHESRQRKGILAIREDAKGEIFVTGIKEERLSGPEGILECLKTGSLCRTTKSTQMNLVSSRSHAIFTISLRQRKEDGQTYYSKLHFVDLAGSERLKRTQAQGDRAKESISINSGLLALGNVISALGDETKKATHIPYRDSKLTRLLQDSLGGNSRTLMIACISPSSDNLLESLNTLKYANRARNIKNHVTAAVDAAGDAAFEVVQLKKQVAALKQQLNNLRQAKESAGGSTEEKGGSTLKRENEELKRRIEALGREKRMVEQERDSIRAALNNDPSKSPKVKEYLRTISELRSKLIRFESAPSANGPVAVGGSAKKPSGPQRVLNNKTSMCTPVKLVEPETPKWFQAADDLLCRAKTEIEQTYEAMEAIEDAPSAYLPVEDDHEMEGVVQTEQSGGLYEQVAAAVATRTEQIMGQIRVDLQLRAELVQQIEDCKKEFLFMRERYEERIRLLQENMKAIQDERDRALAANPMVSAEARVGLNRITREKYEDRIKKLGKEINELKDKLRGALHSTSSKSSASENLIRNLKSNLANAKAENARLQLTITEQITKLKQETSEQEQALKDLRQSERKAQESSKKWKRAYDFQKGLLQKRIEQCLHARAKIRQLVQALRKHRVNLASPSVGIDLNSPGWKALQGEERSPLLPARVRGLADGDIVYDDAEDVPTVAMNVNSPVRKFPALSQLAKQSVSVDDLESSDLEDSDLVKGTSQLVIDRNMTDAHRQSEPGSPFLLPSAINSGLNTAVPSRPTSVLAKAVESAPTGTEFPTKSILRASPLIPRRRDFFGRLAEAAMSILSPSKQQKRDADDNGEHKL